MWISEWHKQDLVASAWGVQYSYILASLNCALRCVGISQAKTIGVDQHLEVVVKYSVWHSVSVTQGIVYIYCTGGMCYASAAVWSCSASDLVELKDRM